MTTDELTQLENDFVAHRIATEKAICQEKGKKFTLKRSTIVTRKARAQVLAWRIGHRGDGNEFAQFLDIELFNLMNFIK
ncbi:hypothetical protein D6S13_24005 [Salmonella enterica subsp. enterica]|nr:hypothetical protein [Salmonella enterica subsp. enterica]